MKQRTSKETLHRGDFQPKSPQRVCCVENMVCGASSEYGTSGLISHTHSRSSSDLSTHHYYSA